MDCFLTNIIFVVHIMPISTRTVVFLGFWPFPIRRRFSQEKKKALERWLLSQRWGVLSCFILSVPTYPKLKVFRSFLLGCYFLREHSKWNRASKAIETLLKHSSWAATQLNCFSCANSALRWMLFIDYSSLTLVLRFYFYITLKFYIFVSIVLYIFLYLAAFYKLNYMNNLLYM